MLSVIGHRGARTLAVENSLLACRAAREGGADGVEIDVQLSADGEPVVFHDDDLQRLCGVPRPLWQEKWRDLRVLRMVDAELQPQPMAHLDEVLEWWATARGALNLELKVAAGLPTGQLRRLQQVVARRLQGLEEQPLVVSSFSPLALSGFAELAPQVRCAALVEPETRGEFARLLREPQAASGSLGQVHPHFSLVTAERLRAFAARQWPVWTWTVNAPAEWQRLVELAVSDGLHGIITDHPLELRGFLQRHAPHLCAA